MIALHDVSKTYGAAQALQPTSLTIPRGKTTALIGPSGCGKSTVLRLVVGLIAATTGKVEVDGVEVEPISVQSLRRKMGYVIQDGGLFPHLTAEGNILLMARHLRIPEAECQERLGFLCALTHFETSMLKSYPLELSGGQRQRVSLMRALQLDPEILLFDEPLGALDSIVRASLQDELKSIFNKLKKTVVLVTHDLAEAAYLSDSMVMMKDGAIVQEGSLHDFRSKPADPFVSRLLNAQRGLATL